MSKDENNDKNIDLRGYNSGGISLLAMKVGLWLAERRRGLIKLLIVFLISLSAFFFTYSTYHYILYFLAGDPNADFRADNLILGPRRVTEDLIVSPVQVFVAGDRSDLVAKVTNPNANFSSAFRYCFYWLDQDLLCAEDFILPGEEKYLLALGLSISGSPETGGLYLTDVSWRRINAREIPDWTAFRAERHNFQINKVNFIPGAQSSLSGRLNLNSLSFTVKNSSPYGYYQVPLNILFFRGSDLVGVNRHIINNFLGGEERAVSLAWPGNIGGVSRVDILPLVNILDDRVYIPYQGQSF